MTVLLGSLQFVCIIIICIYEFKHKSISVFLWATLLVMFGIMHFITVLSGYLKYPNWVLNEASGFVIFFCIFYFILRCVLQSKKKAISINYLQSTIEKNTTPLFEIKYKKINSFFEKYMFILLIIVLLYFANQIIAIGGLFQSSWGGFQTILNKYFSFSRIILPLYICSTSLLSYYVYKRNILGSVLLTALIILKVLLSRNRVEILPLLIPIIFLIVLNKKKLTYKIITITIIVGVFSIYMIYALRVFRHYGSLASFINTATFYEFNQRVLSYFFAGDGELNLREVFYFFIYNQNNFKNFNQGHTYLRMILSFIPTGFSFGLKPPDFAISMGQAYLPGVAGFSTHPTLFGDCYANFGFWGGILSAAIWGSIVSLVNKIVAQKNPAMTACLASIWAYFFVIAGRGSVYNAFITSAYATIFLFLLYLLAFISAKITN